MDDLSTGSMENISHLLDSPNFCFKQGSILDHDVLESVFTDEFTVDTVFHLASLVGVQLVISKPLEVLRNAINGITLVMEAAARHHCRVLVASSSEVYGKNISGNISEEDDRILGSPLKSRWSYSEGKAMEELIAYTYWHEKGIPVVIARMFNTVGPRQSGDYGMVLPRFVRQAMHGEPLTVYGDGMQRRCFCYVGDVVPALVELVEHDRAYGRAFNIGSRAEITIEALARRVIELIESNSTLHFIPYEDMPDGFEDMPRRVPDITAIQQLTSFNPHTSLDDIIMMLVSSR